MKKFTKTVVAAVALAGCVATSAHAAVDDSTITPATTVLVFSQAVSLTHTLTPVGTLPLTLVDDTTLANGSATLDDGSNANFAFRWTPGTAVVDGHKGTMSGVNDDSHKLVAMLEVANEWYRPPVDGWYVPDVAAAAEATYIVLASGDQTVAADSYLLSIDAAVWNA